MTAVRLMRSETPGCETEHEYGREEKIRVSGAGVGEKRDGLTELEVLPNTAGCPSPEGSFESFHAGFQFFQAGRGDLSPPPDMASPSRFSRMRKSSYTSFSVN
jgi:hypothetical protein